MEVSIFHCAVMGFGDGIHEAVPHTCFPPSDEAIVAGSVRPVSLRQMAPWRTRSQHPEDTVEHLAVVDARHSSHVGQQWLDRALFEVS